MATNKPPIPMDDEQRRAIVRAVQTVDFIEPCSRCASREKMALVRLLFAGLSHDERISVLVDLDVLESDGRGGWRQTPRERWKVSDEDLAPLPAKETAQ